MLKALLTRFENTTCALVDQAQSGTVNAFLEAMSDSEHLSELMMHPSAANMASDFWLSADNWMSRYRPYQVKNGVLSVPVKGVMLNDFPWQYGSWATGYEYIKQAITRGLADPEVKGIALIVDTPGGAVSGNFELSDFIYESRSQKRIVAFAHDSAYSAGYSIASAAESIVMSRSGGVGSIGVVTSHVDMSKMMDERGIKVTFIHFGKHKVDGNPYEALKPEVKERIQARIDTLGEQFVALVARNRGLDASVVRGTEALTYPATEALSIGLADKIGPLEEAVAAFAVELSTNSGGKQMDEATAAANQAAIDKARADGKAEGKAEGAREEKTRITSILASDSAKERPVAAMAAAMDTDMPVEQATAFLDKMPKEAAVTAPAATEQKPDNGQQFNSAMSQDKPEVGADGKEVPQKTLAESTSAMMGWGAKK